MASFDVDDTIVAVASATGFGMRGIIRLSGQDCLACLFQAFEMKDSNLRESILRHRRTVRLPIHLPLSTAGLNSNTFLNLPGDLIIWPTAQSYTRQPAAEFHTFASNSLLSMGVKRFCQTGARLAQPGEFTLRAFLSGRLDLVQAEAVLAVIDAQNSNQLDGALKQLAGGLSEPLSLAREQLLFILAELEAGLDFVEEDIEFISIEMILEKLFEIEANLTRISDQIKSREMKSDTVRVALIGLPNAGKSSLFNALLGTERAIVSNLSGTTTDFLTGQLQLDGINVELLDTAGKENSATTGSENRVAELAQQQREFAQSQAQIHLLCLDASIERDPWEWDQVKQMISNPQSRSMIVLTHSDLVPANTELLYSLFDQQPFDLNVFKNHWIATRLDQPSSIDPLKQWIRRQAIEITQMEEEVVGSTLVRTADSLRSALSYVQAAEQAAQHRLGEEIIAAEIRGALEELGLVVGAIYTDDILDIVFSRFCIGK